MGTLARCGLCGLTLSIASLGTPSAVANVNTAATQCPGGTFEGLNVVENGDFSAAADGTTPVAFTTEFNFVDTASVGENSVAVRNGEYADGDVLQSGFPGDAARGIASTDSWLYANGNTLPSPTNIWQQNVPVQQNKLYSIFFYASNAADPALSASVTQHWTTPRVGLSVNGNSGSQMTLRYELGSDEWSLAQTVFWTGSSTSLDIRIIDLVNGQSLGDHVAIAAINARVCGDSPPPAPVADNDNDGVPDNLDLDDDNDGIPDSVEGTGDADGDGVVNAFDLDSDNDGVFDLHEAWPGNRALDFAAGDLGYDTDADGRAGQGAVTVDANGVVLSSVTGAFSYPSSPVNSDTDGLPDRRDPDSDGDGASDLLEGTADSDLDGVPDFRDDDDADNDGVPDSLDLDDDNDGIPDSVEQSAVGLDTDTDGDGIVDRLDLDSDNDGIFDLDEAGLPDATTLNRTGGRLTGSAVGENGLVDGLETSPDSGATDYDRDGLGDDPADSDGDLLPDFRDLDTDNDGVPDALESGNDVVVSGGRIQGSVSASGLPVGATYDPPVDTDLDDRADFRDLDSDQDGLSDTQEVGLLDVDNDGRVDALEDADGDGMHDGAATRRPDRDGDGVPDALEPGDAADNPEITGKNELAIWQTGLTGAGASGSLFLLFIFMVRVGMRLSSCPSTEVDREKCIGGVELRGDACCARDRLASASGRGCPIFRR